jgi:hypothetical protein
MNAPKTKFPAIEKLGLVVKIDANLVSNPDEILFPKKVEEAKKNSQN